jgi:hypothetical protein
VRKVRRLSKGFLFANDPLAHQCGRCQLDCGGRNKQRSIPGAEWTKERAAKDASRAVKEYLATLDDAAFGAASEVTPKFVSPSDPAAQWTGAMRGPAFFAYADNYLVDVKCGVIVDVSRPRAPFAKRRSAPPRG